MKYSAIETEIISTLEEGTEASTDFKGIPVDNPPSVDPETYNLNHSKGEFAVFVSGIKSNAAEHDVNFTLKRQIFIEIWAIVKKLQDNNPIDYCEHLQDVLEGRLIEENNFKSAVLHMETELVYERKGEWFYRNIFTAGGLKQKTV